MAKAEFQSGLWCTALTGSNPLAVFKFNLPPGDSAIGFSKIPGALRCRLSGAAGNPDVEAPIGDTLVLHVEY